MFIKLRKVVCINKIEVCAFGSKVHLHFRKTSRRLRLSPAVELSLGRVWGSLSEKKGPRTGKEGKAFSRAASWTGPPTAL